MSEGGSEGGRKRVREREDIRNRGMIDHVNLIL